MQHLIQGLIAVAGDVLVDVLGIDHAAVAQRGTVLLLIEGGVVQGQQLAGLVVDAVLVEQILDDVALHQVLMEDGVHVLELNAAVERALGVDDDDRAGGAQAEAAGMNQFNFLFQVILLHQLLETVQQIDRAGRSAAGAAADEHVRTEKLHSRFSSLECK